MSRPRRSTGRRDAGQASRDDAVRDDAVPGDVVPDAATARGRGMDWSWRHTLLVLSVCVVFGRAATHEFTWWDDRMTIGQNERFTPPTLEGLAYYWSNHEYGLYYPVTNTLWWLLAFPSQLQVADPQGVLLNPWIYHAANVVVHAISVLLAFSILRRLLRDDRASLLGALVFALHPVQVEPVAWASGMKDLLCWCFVLGAIRLHLLQRDTSSRLVWVAMIAAGALAMLSKPTAVVLPVALVLIDRFALERGWRASIVSAVPLVAIAAGVAVMASIAQPAHQTIDVPLHLRPVIAADAVAFYLWKLVWPIDLAIDYGRHPQYVLLQWWAWVTWIAPVTIAIVLLALRKRLPLLLLAGMLFVLGVGPVLGFKKFLFQGYSTTADHYLYFSMLGVALAIGVMLRHFRSRGITIALSLIIALLATRSFLQVGVWRDDDTLFNATLRINPRSAMAHNNLGYVYSMRKIHPIAIMHFEQALALRPTEGIYHHNLADALVEIGQIERALHHAEVARQLHREQHDWAGAEAMAQVQVDAATIAARAGRFELAEQYLVEADRLLPGFTKTADLRQRIAQVRQASDSNR